MNATGHTPGPWQLESDRSISAMTVPAVSASPIRWTVAEIWSGGAASTAEADCNARLISAAPDLLEALRLADAAMCGAHMDMRAVERSVRAAIAKATGGAA